MATDIHCTVTTTLHRFSSRDEEEEEDSMSTEYNCDSTFFDTFFKVTFHGNGSRPEDDGHVSIVFKVHFTIGKVYSSATLSCTAYAVDASGNRRFPQSFVVQHDLRSRENVFLRPEGFGFRRFLRRSTLLSNPDELLPGDSLTLCLEIDFAETRCHRPMYPEDDTHAFLEDDDFYLPMDTEFGRDLRKMSPVLRRMMESPMLEKETGCLRMEVEESTSFKLIFSFLRQEIIRAPILFVCELYVLADKYDMGQVLRLCHQLLISLMLAINSRETLTIVEASIHNISDLVAKFDKDENLGKILNIYSDIKNKFEGGACELCIANAGELETEWRCINLMGSNNFEFSKIDSECLLMDALK